MSVFGKLRALLTRRERVSVVLLALGMVPLALLEMAGVASIVPFLQVIADPSVFEGQGLVAVTSRRLGFESADSALFALGGALFVIIALTNVANALMIWRIQRFSWDLSHRLGTDVLSRYLWQPYRFFLGRNTASLNQKLLSEVNYVVTGVAAQFLQLGSRAATATLIVGLLVWFDWKLAGAMVLFFGCAYGVVYAWVRRSQYTLGQERHDQNLLRFRIAQEALAGIKDVKALGRESEFLRRYASPSRKFADAAASHAVTSGVPRHVLEVLGFGGIVLVVLYLLRTDSDIGSVLPALGLYAFAGYRLMPAVNQIFQSVVAIRFNSPALDALYSDMVLDDGSMAASGGEAPDRSAEIGFEPTLEFSEVGFRYEERAEPTLSGVNLTIRPKQVIGLVGTTGSGKTTLVDLLLGLLTPTEGRILVDGCPLDAGLSVAWRGRCGYVPQDIFLCDDTITANIAFGIPSEDVDSVAIEASIHMAQLDGLIAALPEGRATVVGERGVRLSGGERQRIGIARALYHDPDVIVMDEATNALDGVTEAAVMETVGHLMGKKTLVLIAHRLSTVRQCDVIHLLEEGRILASGSYDELYAENQHFHAMAEGLGTAGPTTPVD